MIKLALYIMVTLMLVGCTQEPLVVIKTKYRYYSISKELLVDDINITQPPKKEVYINSNPIEREMLLRDYIIELYVNIDNYKIKLKKINKENDDIEKIISKANKTK